MSSSRSFQHGDPSWWREARFGMFVHWGLYSIPARHEWVMSTEKMPPDVYEKYQEFFDPDRFDAAEWAHAARKAGMKYFVFTAKHHEGFCMWDTKFTAYKAKRDYVREIVDAFRNEGLRVGLYYSLLDWHHPDFTVDDNHPLRDGNWEELNRNRSQHRYCEYMRNQVTELLTNYGKIDVLWFDFTYDRPGGKGPKDWEAEELLALVRRLQPDVLIDNRLGLDGAGDFVSPEQYVPLAPPCDASGKPLDWEGCQTFSGSWGYFRDETGWKTEKQLVSMLIDHVSRGGNLLMNAGPTARGEMDFRTIASLEYFHRWMDRNRESIYGCGAAPSELPEPDRCRYTYNKKTNRLYVHIMDYPVKFLHLPKLSGKVRFARLLGDHSEILMRPQGVPHGNMAPSVPPDTQTLVLPPLPPSDTVPVIELFLTAE